MNSRERILERLRRNKPATPGRHDVRIENITAKTTVDLFTDTLISIGGAVATIHDLSAVENHVAKAFPTATTLVNALDEIPVAISRVTPHELANVEVAILRGEFGVAENGAVWITDNTMFDRALPFITAHLLLVIDKKNIVNTMHEAYTLIDRSDYAFGTFIAGPSKTADIEQSLVLGAHGPKSLTVFLLE